MTPPLASILTCVDLPAVELQAARMDGELFGIDECFSPVDLPEAQTQRAHALASILPERLIAEQLTAAWIWGVTDLMPTRHQLCAAAGARARPANPRGLAIREVVIDEGEIVSLGALSVTSPLRTAFDITRSSTSFGPEEQSMVLRLLVLAGSTIQECREFLNGRRNLPGKRLTRDRLDTLEAAQAARNQSDAA